MIPLYNQKEFELAKSTDKLPCECYQCKQVFYKEKKEITRVSKSKNRDIKFCSHLCNGAFHKTKIKVNCDHCKKEFEKSLPDYKKSKNHFCSLSCNRFYQNANKIFGSRRSKLEIWLEGQLTNLYPNLEIHYNKTSAIKSELDIYIPSLNVAFELNGIFHYEPIYGVNKLNQIQENDKSKSKACHEAKIDLCIIDTSGQKYVKPSTSQKYLDIITNIINERLLTS